MNNDDWQQLDPRGWEYRVPQVNRWLIDYATIRVSRKNEWHLFINRTYVATFNSWDEARDATPMMLKLHGHESQS